MSKFRFQSQIAVVVSLFFLSPLISLADTSKVGFVDTTGKIVVPLEYDDAGDFHEGLAWVEKNGKFGFIDTKGRVVISLKFDGAENFSKGLAEVRKLTLTGYLRRVANHLTKEKYGDYEEKPSDFRIGVIDKSGKALVKPKYETVTVSPEGLFLVLSKGKWGHLDRSGKKIGKLAWDQAGTFSEGLAWIEIQGKFGYVDTKGKLVIPAIYESAKDFSDGLAGVMVGGKWGYLDSRGVWAIQPQFWNAGKFSKGIAVVSVGLDDGTSIRNDYNIIDRNGRKLLKNDMTLCRGHDTEFIGDYAIFSAPTGRNRFVQIINRKGELVFEGEEENARGYDWIAPHEKYPGGPKWPELSREDLASLGYISATYDGAKFNGKDPYEGNTDTGWFVSDRPGKGVDGFYKDRDGKVGPWSFEEFRPQKFGHRDGSGKVVIEPKFDEAHPFVSGLALVGNYEECFADDTNDKTEIFNKMRYSLIDLSGKEVVAFPMVVWQTQGKSDDMYPFVSFKPSLEFQNGVWRLKLSESLEEFLDKDGRQISGWFCDVGEFSDGLAKVKKCGPWSWFYPSRDPLPKGQYYSIPADKSFFEPLI